MLKRLMWRGLFGKGKVDHAVGRQAALSEHLLHEFFHDGAPAVVRELVRQLRHEPVLHEPVGALEARFEPRPSWWHGLFGSGKAE